MLTVRLCAAGLSFVAFATALIVGLVAENDYVTIVTRALSAMAVFYVIGNILGRVGQVAIEQSFERQKEAIEQEVRAEFSSGGDESSVPDDVEIETPDVLEEIQNQVEEPELVGAGS